MFYPAIHFFIISLLFISPYPNRQKMEWKNVQIYIENESVNDDFGKFEISIRNQEDTKWELEFINLTVLAPHRKKLSPGSYKVNLHREISPRFKYTAGGRYFYAIHNHKIREGILRVDQFNDGFLECEWSFKTNEHILSGRFEGTISKGYPEFLSAK